jgi:hypothetical protein
MSGSSDTSEDLSSPVSSDDSVGKLDDLGKLDDMFYEDDSVGKLDDVGRLDDVGEPGFDIDLLSDASSHSDKGVDDLSDEDCRPMKARRRDMELPTSLLKNGSFVEERCSVQWLRDLTAECEDKPSLKNLKRKIDSEDRKLKRRVASAETKLTATASAYNKLQLRREDRLDPNPLDRKARRLDTWTHSKAWTLSGAVELAFSSIGMLSPRANTLKKTRRALDAISAVAMSANHGLRSACNTLGASIRHGARRCQWLLVDRSHDATPLRLQFGQLQSELTGAARYWHWSQDGRFWSLLGSEEFQAVNGMLPGYLRPYEL